MWATHGWPTLARPPGPCEHSSLWWRGGNATPQSFSQQLGPLSSCFRHGGIQALGLPGLLVSVLLSGLDHPHAGFVCSAFSTGREGG